jgi:host factor-I protein
MAQMPESKATSSPNIQDAFLNLVRRERFVVRIRLMDGADVEARIKNFDRFAVIIEHDGVDALVFKHAIASITAPKSMPNYYAAPQD